MTTLTAEVTIYAITPNNDGSSTFRVMGQILNAGNPVGDFVADFVDQATAALMVIGSTYLTTLVIP